MNFYCPLESENAPEKLKFLKIADNIDRVSALLDFALVKVTSAGAVLPALIIVAVNYFVNDMGDESYYLSFPMM